MHVAPARTRICQRLRRALIRSQLPPVLNERFRALAVRTHSLSQVAMRPLAARRVIRAVRATGRRACLDCIAAVGRPPSVCCLTANRHDRRDGLSGLQGLGIRLDLRPYLLPPVRWFRHVRILLPCPYAARCPVPIAGDDAEVILELSVSWHADDGRLSWCDRNHGHGQSAHAHQAAAPGPCCGPGLNPGLLFSLHAAVAGGLQPTSVSAPSSRAAGPHVGRH